jgi:hypothetical protein
VNIDSFITQFSGWTEEYHFYNGEVTLRYDPKEHVYFLVNNGELEKLAGVTKTCGIIDKSEALVPWAAKMMSLKLFNTTPTMTLPTGEKIVPQMAWPDYEKLVNEAKSAHKDRLEDAGEVGHIAHDWVERYIKIILQYDAEADHTNRAILDTRLEVHLANLPSDERAKNACVAALDWMQQHSVRWRFTERKIYSRTYKYAGTLDGLAFVDSCTNPNCCPHQFKGRLSIVDWKTSNYLNPGYLLQTASYEFAYEEETGEDVLDRWVIRLGKDDGEFESWHTEPDLFDLHFDGFLTCLKLTELVGTIKGIIQAKARAVRDSINAEKKAIREAKERAEKHEKARAKAEEQQARVEALRLKCTKADKYKAVRKPGCKTGTDGEPCVSCAFKYAKAQEGKPEKKAVKKRKAKVAGIKLVCIRCGGLPHYPNNPCIFCGKSQLALPAPNREPDYDATYPLMFSDNLSK